MSQPSQLSFNLQPCLQRIPLLSTNRRLNALSKSNRLQEARHLFDEMPHRDEFTWNTMISAYARSGLLSEALHLFNTTPYLQSSVPWSSLISGFSRHSLGPDALLLFRRMRAHGIHPDPYSIGGALRACSTHSFLHAGEQLHANAIKASLHLDPFVAAGFVDMYAKCGRLAEATQLFAAVPPSDRNNRVLWTAMVTGHAHNGDGPGAMDRFRLMRSEGVGPNQFTFPSVLTACGSELALGFGRQVHGCTIRTGFEANSFVQSSLVGMYSKCSDLGSAKRVLEVSNSDDSVSWNTLIVSCSRNGFHEDALSLFVEMHQRALEMDEFTYPSVLNSVASDGDAANGRSLHCLILKSGFETHCHVGNALVDMYAKCGRLDCARGVFDKMPEKDVVTWTSLITGCARHASDERALHLFCEMREAGVDSDEFVMAGVLSSCAALTVLQLGRQVHATIVRRGFDSFRSVGNSLVSMYAKSGCIDEARRVFDTMILRDAITWTALIVGYAQNGRGTDSLHLYDRMVQIGPKPDYVTFIGLLFACSHAGLVDHGRSYFESMERVHRIAPGPEHYACMIDLLGRSGRVNEAAALLDRMTTEPDTTVWKALLGVCRVHGGSIGVAERAAEKLFEMEPTDAVPYVLLSNLYSAARRWDDVARIRALMRSRGVSKEPGRSWMEVGGVVQVFHVEERRHPRTVEIYAMVEEMMGRIRGEEGYVAQTEFALHDVGEEGKELGLAYHSEKLAVAFGLLSVPRGAPIRVFKNLRVCGDCHTALRLVSKVYGRGIVLRDANCFHHFNEGACSCGDYW